MFNTNLKINIKNSASAIYWMEHLPWKEKDEFFSFVIDLIPNYISAVTPSNIYTYNVIWINKDLFDATLKSERYEYIKNTLYNQGIELVWI